MASVYYFIDDAQDIADNIIANTEAKFELDKKRFFAALIIQRTFRGYVVRNEYKKWWKAALTIQRHVRGFLDRVHLLDKAAELFRRKCLRLFNRMAIRIQSNWRGYWVRKSINIKDIMDNKKIEQEHIGSMQKLFLEIFKRMQNSSEFSLNLEELPENIKSLRKITKKSPDIIKSLFDRHHLLRTFQTEGVLSIHDSKELSVLEKFLKRFDYKQYMDKVKNICKASSSPEIEYMFSDKRTRKMEDLFRTISHSDEPVKKMENMNKFSNAGPFNLYAKLPKHNYERTLFAKEDYTGIRQPTFRDRVKHDISDHDFDLDVHHIKKNPEQDIPHQKDHWKKACCNHNLMYDFIEDRNG